MFLISYICKSAIKRLRGADDFARNAEMRHIRITSVREPVSGRTVRMAELTRTRRRLRRRRRLIARMIVGDCANFYRSRLWDFNLFIYSNL